MTDVLFTIGENPPPRLDKALARNVPERAISRSRLSRMIAEGAVEVNGAVVTDQKARVQEGDDIVIRVPDVVESHMLPEDIPLEVLFEDNDLIVVNKPAGMVVHPAPGTPSGTLVNALLAHCGENLSGVGGLKRPGIVHRIDKDTSGLLVVAKSDAAHQGLADQFLDHSIERLYTAVCFGVPSAGDPRLMGLAGTSFEAGNQLKITTQLARQLGCNLELVARLERRSCQPHEPRISRRGHTKTHRCIKTLNAVVQKLIRQTLMGRIRFGHDQKPTGVFINAVHNPWTFQPTHTGKIFTAMGQKRVDQRS